MLKRTWFLLFLVGLVLVACGGSGTAGQPSGGAANQPAAAVGDAGNGQKLFTAGKGPAPVCSGCHSVKPGETLVGPSLAGVATVADKVYKESNYKGKAKSGAEWLRESIVDPNAYIAEGFSANVMYGNYGKDLSVQDLNDLVAYLQTLK
jgi:nitric oxide reductase subunit C